jgi:hypothetical protein
MKGLPRSLAHAKGDVLQKIVVPITNVTISVVDGAPGYGSVALAGLPEGNVLFIGAVAYIQLLTVDADITTTFDGDFSIGTAATANGDLVDANEADIIPSTALGAATAKLSPVVRGASTDALGGGIIDNTANTLNLNLNLLIDDAAISGAADFTVNGTLNLAYIVLGDD